MSKSKVKRKFFSKENSFFLKRDFILKENKAQAEAVFRLMIDSVVGLAILLVILSALSYFEGQVIVQSKSDFFDLVRNSVNSPTGSIIKSKELTFSENFSINTLDLRNSTFLSENCFKFEGVGAFIKITDEKRVEFLKGTKVIVYGVCFPNPSCDPYTNPSDYSSCCSQCTISFGKPPA